jgi:hypothetical protein
MQEEPIQMANGKRQKSNGLQFTNFSNPKTICHLTFAICLLNCP